LFSKRSAAEPVRGYQARLRHVGCVSLGVLLIRAAGWEGSKLAENHSVAGDLVKGGMISRPFAPGRMWAVALPPASHLFPPQPAFGSRRNDGNGKP